MQLTETSTVVERALQAPPAAGELSAEAVWETARPDLQQRLPEGNFTAWFGNAKPVAIDGTSFVLAVPSAFVKEWIEARYMDEVQASLSAAAGDRPLSVVLLADPSIAAGEESEISAPPAPAPSAPPAPAIEPSHFHPKYTFDSFVIGSSTGDLVSFMPVDKRTQGGAKCT